MRINWLYLFYSEILVSVHKLARQTKTALRAVKLKGFVTRNCNIGGATDGNDCPLRQATAVLENLDAYSGK